MRQTSLAAIYTVCSLLTACGGDTDQSGQNASEQPPIEIPSNDTNSGISFADTNVVQSFEWQMASNQNLSFELISNVSQAKAHQSNHNDDEWLSISGKHMVHVYPIEADANISTQAIFVGLTDQFGQLAVNFNLLETWIGLSITVDIDGQTCTQTIDRQDLENLVRLGCNIALDSDQE